MEEKITKEQKKELRHNQWQANLEKERKKKLFTMLSLWGFGTLLVVLAVVGLVAFSNGTNMPTSSSIVMPKLTSRDYTQGPIHAKVTLTEYADFECPACKAYYPVLKQLQKDYANKMLFAYRFFPLKSIHPNAINSARAGYAAGLQGKFWQMHDKLFDTQDAWAVLSDPELTFISYAKSMGLNTTIFQKDYEAASTESIVNNAYDADVTLGLNSTPTFFLNGKLINNPTSYDEFKKIISTALAEK